MLPPPPASRKSSYIFSHPHQSTSGFGSTSSPIRSTHGRLPSFRTAAENVLGLDHEEDSSNSEEEEEGADTDGRERGLEETLEKIGFGSYHWRLLALCGFGWMSDNSALQCIAVILPRVQVHFNLSSKVVGLLSASTMAGMMIGAVAWGVISDLLGRSLPFNATLFLTAVFGIAASFSPDFGVLCIWMFLLGSAVGGSMPTDGTLFLENLPHSKQYLLTLLSVFFSLGAVLSSVVSLVFLPGHSCKTYEGCDIPKGENEGWRRVMFVLGLFNLACAFARWFLFRLQESPRYLISNGRESEAIIALQAIATFNSNSMDIQRADVQTANEQICMNGERTEDDKSIEDQGIEGLPRWNNQLEFDHEHGKYGGLGIGKASGSGSGLNRKEPLRMGSDFYNTSTSTPGLIENENRFENSFSNANISEEREILFDSNGNNDPQEGEEKKYKNTNDDDDGDDEFDKWHEKPLVWWRSWLKQMNKLFVPQWRKTVILMWIIWGAISFGYTMFNVWLPSVLESKATGEGDEAIKEALNDYVLYSLAGCPGSIIGAWMIQTWLGRRKSLAICTLATGLSTFAFINVEAKWAVVVSSMIISAAATAMYAVLYGMTPETFGTSIRGTACGTSAALSRFTGVIAPVSAGFLLTISPSLPVFVSAAIFVGTAGCALALPFERVGGGGKGGALMH
ncbi:membrane transporter [Kwoniella mangroviensis CBS 10435]|uniref:Membrane transporter n=1 Tax=Kwoniella mangroviensis CBS 10435 TaxID=1331196 RepID=A0A1B9IUV8_9TREE|nr:membrane transporter [Kwoniella mangroviensis CBS 8507]OCF59316.1 membrane transporter [Kwoniella mangroviensis CBS 10435]OCF62720.1 membrane transporter [Kwoniella mangroviensis CBS 8507]